MCSSSTERQDLLFKAIRLISYYRYVLNVVYDEEIWFQVSYGPMINRVLRFSQLPVYSQSTPSPSSIPCLALHISPPARLYPKRFPDSREFRSSGELDRLLLMVFRARFTYTMTSIEQVDSYRSRPQSLPGHRISASFNIWDVCYDEGERLVSPDFGPPRIAI